MKNILKIIFPIIIYICFFTSCKKQRGCTNKDAINFNVTADIDDGSCIVCHTIETQLDSDKVYLKDKKFSSPHYNQTIAKFSLTQDIETPTDKVCGKENCRISLTVKSLINQNMYFSYYISRFSGPVNFSYGNDITVNANETTTVGTITTFNNPPFLEISLDSINIFVNGDIIYY